VSSSQPYFGYKHGEGVHTRFLEIHLVHLTNSSYVEKKETHKEIDDTMTLADSCPKDFKGRLSLENFAYSNSDLYERIDVFMEGKKVSTSPIVSEDSSSKPS